MTLKRGGPITGARSARLWAKPPSKVNQGRLLKRAAEGLKLPLFGTRDRSLP